MKLQCPQCYRPQRQTKAGYMRADSQRYFCVRLCSSSAILTATGVAVRVLLQPATVSGATGMGTVLACTGRHFQVAPPDIIDQQRRRLRQRLLDRFYRPHFYMLSFSHSLDNKV